MFFRASDLLGVLLLMTTMSGLFDLLHSFKELNEGTLYFFSKIFLRSFLVSTPAINKKDLFFEMHLHEKE